ncbi:MAG: hypothetical protein LBV30_02535 [Propionibacteriaceae bacterium]|nr:hypothetical protein [Propionibacteriaceae bacterium]
MAEQQFNRLGASNGGPSPVPSSAAASSKLGQPDSLATMGWAIIAWGAVAGMAVTIAAAMIGCCIFGTAILISWLSGAVFGLLAMVLGQLTLIGLIRRSGVVQLVGAVAIYLLIMASGALAIIWAVQAELVVPIWLAVGVGVAVNAYLVAAIVTFSRARLPLLAG